MTRSPSTASWPRLLGSGVLFALFGTALAVAQAPVEAPAQAAPDASDGAPESPPADDEDPPMWVTAPLYEAAPSSHDGAFEQWALARYHNTPVFVAMGPEAWGLGIVRRGSTLRARLRSQGPGCDGHWFELEQGGYVCSTRGFRVRAQQQDQVGDEAEPPNFEALLPYRYGRVVSQDAFRYEDLPTQAQRDRLAAGVSMPGVAEKLVGDYFVTIDGEVEHEGHNYVRTVAGRYVDAEYIGDHARTELHGELLDDDTALPLAFVIDDETPSYRVSAEGLVAEGTAPKYSRFRPTGLVTRGEVTCVLTALGACIPRDSLRVVWAIDRPSGVPAGERWVHVNLSEQTLVAYEGDRALFATVITSGKAGYDTPEGTYRIQHKYLSIRMSGDDPVEGVYDVDEVPWTMYYHRGYALHGAYWHDGFGRVRSHGCTNIAPADARWLYRWTTPHVPRGWHGRREEGTWVHNTTGGTAPLGVIDVAPDPVSADPDTATASATGTSRSL
ncbi:MAG: L,D-transpeptidase [Deltaproteobacteria bacterium]|nr:L,D-transpeptidase [Deltaproteobacteria bacterium]